MRRIVGLFVTVAIAVAGCVDSGGSGGGSGDALTPFGDEASLLEYLRDLPSGGVAPDLEAGEADASVAAPAPAANEAITNVQEAGVDEGDIVKNVGDHLVVLRQGRLYAVSVAEPGAPAQAGSIRVAPSDELNDGVWYDEMLVDGDRVYVVGYRYSVALGGAAGEAADDWTGATEVNTFRLTAGGFERLGTTFVESWDYYSSDNYASRLVDGRLVFYMPFSAWLTDGRDAELPIPRVLRALPDGSFEPGGALFAAEDVYRPIERPETPVFHTIVSCGLPEDGSLDCRTKSLLGDAAREFYVSPTDVFLWTDAHVYAFDMEGQTVSAHAVSGYPADQFAFRQIERTLHVATLDGSGTLAVVSLDLDAFDERGEQPADTGRVVLSESRGDEWGGVSAERWIGDTFVAAVGGGEGGDVVVYRAGAGEVGHVEPDFAVSRIEAVGEDRALAAGSGSGVVPSLELRVLDLEQGGETVGAASLASSGEGETRSHGFFFKPAGDGGGVFGLPVIQEQAGPGPAPESGEPIVEDTGGWWGSGISNVAFVAVGADGSLATRGAVTAAGDAGVCETSCVDWYGNTRPIFLGERVFALMGSELVEVAATPEVSRLGTALQLTAAS